jgi:Flp pilus assembly protein TadD
MERGRENIARKVVALFLLLLWQSLVGCGASSKGVAAHGGVTGLSEAQVSNISQSGEYRLGDPSSGPKALPSLSAEGLETSGDLCFANGDLSMAFIQYEKSLRMNPDNARIHYKEGLIYSSAGQNEEAVKQFTLVLEKDPDFSQAHEGMGTALFQMKRFKEAEDSLRKAVELDRSLWKSYVLLGIIYDREKKYDLAAREYSQAILLRPNDGLIYNNLGTSYMLAGRYGDAVAVFQKALQTPYPKQRLYNNLALALAKLRNYDGALEAFRRAGNDAQAYNNLGCMYLEQGEVEQAITYFEKAIEANPGIYTLASENLRRARMARLMKQ